MTGARRTMPCQDCCPPGTHVKYPYSTKKECVPCEEGTYNDKPTQKMRTCRRCKTYCEDYGHVITKNCTRTQDLQCGCPNGTYKRFSKCFPFHKCGKGFGVTKPGSTENNTDTECGECSNGKTYSDVSNGYNPCNPCTQCQHGTIEPCTTVSDTKCIILTTKLPTPSPGTTSIPNTEQGITGQTGHGTDASDIYVATGIVSIVLLALLGYCIYKRRNRLPCTKKYKIARKGMMVKTAQAELLNPSRSAPPLRLEIFPGPSSATRKQLFCEYPDTPNRRKSSPTSPSGQVIGLHFEMKPMKETTTPPPSIEIPPRPEKIKDGVHLNEVFIWIARNIGEEYAMFLRALPSEEKGSRLTDVDIQGFEYTEKKIPAILMVGLDKWKERNGDGDDLKILNGIFDALVKIGKNKEAKELCENYAEKVGDESAEDSV